MYIYIHVHVYFHFYLSCISSLDKFGLGSYYGWHELNCSQLETEKYKYILSRIKCFNSWLLLYVPYFLDYFAPLFSPRPRIDPAQFIHPSIIIHALE